MRVAHSFVDAASLRQCHENKHLIPRYGRDTSEAVTQTEKEFDQRYPEYRALLFGSGMSACSALLDVMLDQGRTLYVPHEHYRKLKCVSVTRVGYREYRSLDEIEPGPSLIWVESPSNPHLNVADYGRLAELKQGDVRIVGDLTLAGLSNYTGPDIFDAEIHSCTKYAGGHNDILAGVALVKPVWFDALWDRRSYAGGICDPVTAWLLSRSLKTYDLRLERQVESANRVVGWLTSRGVKVFYPTSSAHHNCGAVVSFLAGFTEDLTDRAGSLKTIQMAPNFGGVDSLIEVCATMSHYGKTPDELKESGIEPDLVRLSVGVEPVDTLIQDLEFLLDAA